MRRIAIRFIPGRHLRYLIPRMLLVCLTVVVTAPALFADQTASSTDEPGSRARFHVDLTKSPVFVRKGFAEEYIRQLPRKTGEGVPWLHIPPSPRDDRTLRIPEMPFELDPDEVTEFTMLVPFQLGQEQYEKLGKRGGVVPGLHLASIADNWAIYLNGVQVRSEMHLDEDGRITAHRGYRDVAFPVDAGLLREGENLLGIRIAGKPRYEEIGLRQVGPYYLAPYTEIEQANAQYMEIVLIGLYLFVGLYHLFIAAIRRRERHYLFYALFSIDVSVYFFSRMHHMQQVVADQFSIYRIELISLYALLPLVGAFFDTLEGGKISRVTKGYALFSLLLIVSVLTLPVPVSLDILMLWQMSALVMASYYFFYSLAYRYVRHGLERYRRQKRSGREASLPQVYLQELLQTPRGNLLIGGVLLFSTGVFDILDAVLFHMDLVMTRYGFLLFTMGTAIILANRFEFLHRQVRELNQSLAKRIDELTITTEQLTASERKYRSLFEGASDPVALLDSDLRFLEANKAAEQLFFPGGKRNGMKLESCLYTGDRDGSLQTEKLHGAIRELGDSGEPTDILLRIRSIHGEPQSVKIRLQHVKGREILLRVHPEEKDPMVDYFVRGKERFELDNKLSMAGQISRRATAPLKRYLSDGEVEFLSMCLSEILINAVEHGNLEVTFDEKTAAMNEERYFDFLLQRSRDPRFKDRTVRLEWAVSEDRAVYRVTDRGPGFDHRSFMAGLNDPEHLSLEHGRGLMMALSAFDSVEYNERGNQVKLVKQLSG